MIRVKGPDAVFLQFLHKTVIGEKAVQHTLLAVEYKLHEAF